jgi:hypothetical protein
MKASVHFVPALAPLLLLAACGEPSGAGLLQSRVTTSMTQEQQCNRVASVQYLPNGARISVPATALFIPGRPDLTECGQYAMASAVQAMLAPRIMYVVIEPYGDIDSPYSLLSRERADRLQTMFSHAGFVPTQPPVLVQTAAVPSQETWGIVLTAGDRG